MKYKIKEGDYVEFKDGKRIGYINCYTYKHDEINIRVTLNNGVNIPYSVIENELPKYFNRIGTYDFTKPKQLDKIERLDMESLMLHPSDTMTDVTIVHKLNEVIDRVNEIGRSNEL